MESYYHKFVNNVAQSQTSATMGLDEAQKALKEQEKLLQDSINKGQAQLTHDDLLRQKLKTDVQHMRKRDQVFKDEDYVPYDISIRQANRVKAFGLAIKSLTASSKTRGIDMKTFKKLEAKLSDHEIFGEFDNEQKARLIASLQELSKGKLNGLSNKTKHATNLKVLHELIHNLGGPAPPAQANASVGVPVGGPAQANASVGVPVGAPSDGAGDGEGESKNTAPEDPVVRREYDEKMQKLRGIYAELQDLQKIEDSDINGKLTRKQKNSRKNKRSQYSRTRNQIVTLSGKLNVSTYPKERPWNDADFSESTFGLGVVKQAKKPKNKPAKKKRKPPTGRVAMKKRLADFLLQLQKQK
jgi:hypothetical protein